jgi:hypothetical protein
LVMFLPIQRFSATVAQLCQTFSKHVSPDISLLSCDSNCVQSKSLCVSPKANTKSRHTPDNRHRRKHASSAKADWCSAFSGSDDATNRTDLSASDEKTSVKKFLPSKRYHVIGGSSKSPPAPTTPIDVGEAQSSWPNEHL